MRKANMKKAIRKFTSTGLVDLNSFTNVSFHFFKHNLQLWYIR